MYLQPKTLTEACAALAAQPMRILAGGTDVFPALGERPLSGPVLDLAAVEGLAGITETAETFRARLFSKQSADRSSRNMPFYDVPGEFRGDKQTVAKSDGAQAAGRSRGATDPVAAIS